MGQGWIMGWIVKEEEERREAVVGKLLMVMAVAIMVESGGV